MEVAANLHHLLGILLHQCLFSKYSYWIVNIHSDDCCYLIFHISEIGQVRLTHMLQRGKTSVFIFDGLMNIVLWLIPSPNPELSLFHAKTPNDSISLAFYMDGIFGAFKTYQEQYIFLHNYFFLCIIWSKLKLTFSKLKIGITKISTLEEEYEIGRRIKLKSDKIEKIWYLGSDSNKGISKYYLSTRCWVLGFTVLTHFLTSLTRKAEWY